METIYTVIERAGISVFPKFVSEILEYHVVPHTEYSAGLYNREYVRTLDSHHDVIRLAVSGTDISSFFFKDHYQFFSISYSILTIR